MTAKTMKVMNEVSRQVYDNKVNKIIHPDYNAWRKECDKSFAILFKHIK